MNTTTPRSAFPAWLNVDAIASPEDLERIEPIKVRMRAFTKEAIELARDCRWANDITNHVDSYGIDGLYELFSEVAGTDELEDLALLIGYLFEPDSNIGDEVATAERRNAAVPGLIDAAAEIHEARSALRAKYAAELEAVDAAGD